MKFALVQGDRICQFASTAPECFPVASGLSWVQVADNTTDQDKFVSGAVVKYVSPPTLMPTLTLDQLYDVTILTEKVLKAVVLSLNDGTLPIGTNKTNAQLKAIIKARM